MTLPDPHRLSDAGGSAFFDPFALHARLDFDFRDREVGVNGPILVHEYSHYLQSVSTVYGVYRVLDWIRTGVRLASLLPLLPSIRIPLWRWWTGEECPQALRPQMLDISIRMGLNDDLEQRVVVPDAAHFSLGALRIARVGISDGEPHIMAIMSVGDGKAIPIGARALAEGMAASAQRIWEDDPHLDRVLALLDPESAGWYTATRTILRDLIGSEEDLDFINVFVCDAAMMTRNPPASFVAAAVAIVEARATTRSAILAAVRGATPEIVEEEVAETRRDIEETLGRLGDEEPFAQGVRRLLTSSLELLERRARQPDFPIDVLCGDRPEQLQPLLQQYPIPCYFSGSRLLSWHGDEALARLGEELLMLEYAMRVLLFGPRHHECPLAWSGSCQAPKSILCSTAPWRIDVDADGMLCAFASAMAALGAVGKVLDRR